MTVHLSATRCEIEASPYDASLLVSRILRPVVEIASHSMVFQFVSYDHRLQNLGSYPWMAVTIPPRSGRHHQFHFI